MSADARQLTLSARGLSYIEYPGELNDFEFIVGDDHHRCPWFVAAFLSHRIAELRAVDTTFCKSEIETEDSKGQFDRFLSLGRGATIGVSTDNLKFWESVSEELKNEDNGSAICEGDITDESVFGHLCRRLRFGFAVSKEAEFIASDLFDFGGRELKRLGKAVVSQILSSVQLKIGSEFLVICETGLGGAPTTAIQMAGPLRTDPFPNAGRAPES
jgi:hypothetical protein